MTNEGPQKYTAQIKAVIFSNPDSTFPVKIMPAKINFRVPDDSAVTEYYFSIMNLSKHDLNPTLVSFPKTLVSVTLPKFIPAGSSADGSIRLTDLGQSTNFEKSATFEFNDSTRTRFTIAIKRGNPAPPQPAAKGQSSH